MSIEEIIRHRDRTTPGAVLAADNLNALRYETLRLLNPRQFAALHASAMINPGCETFAETFDRMVDVLLLTEAAREKERVP